MQSQRRPSPESTYASQAARWKQGFKPPAQQTQQQTDLENALVSELCSSVGSSSFPPREVLQKLLRYLHTLDHDYICELLDDKFESPLWQVKAKALSVLSALLTSAEAEFYKQYYSGRLDLLEDLRNARKDMLRKRADKVYAMLRDYVAPDEESPLEMMRRMQEEEAEEVEAHEVNTLMHTSPVLASQQTPHDLMMDMNDSPRSSSAPLPAPAQDGSAFSFLAQPKQEFAPAQMAAEPMTPPVSNSAFGFLSANGGEVDSPPQYAAEAPGSAFTFMAQQKADSSPGRMPTPSAPSLPSDSSSFVFLNQSPGENSVHAIEHGIPSSSTTEMPSAFAFMGGQQQPQQKAASAVIPTQAPTPALQRRHTVFDTLPEPTMLQPTQMNGKKEEEKEEPKVSDPIHDAFEGLDANDGAEALNSFDAYKPSSDAVHGGISNDTPVPVRSDEPLREVILEIEVPPGPMGVMLDRTIPDMTVIERFVPLPTGDKGLAEVGPILGSLANSPKLLRFKKLMNQAWTANPSTLEIPYVPPPLEEEEGNSTDGKSVEEDNAQPESEDIHTPGSSTGEAYMTRLNGYSSGLADIEAKLKEIIRREHGGQPVVDRRNQLAQLHGTVEKIQTQGIDSVIFGEHRPSNYEEVKEFRSTLVRRADDLARQIQSTASADPTLLYGTMTASDEEKHPVSAFAFVGGDSHSTVDDPPLGISQLQDESSFQFLNANANPQVANVHGGNVAVASSAPALAGNSYGFSFLRENAQQQPVTTPAGPLTISQAPTSPSSSFGVLSADGANPAVEVASNVFAGLSLKDDTPQQQPIPAPALYDTLTKSSHGRPMGLSDLEASLRSTASSRPPLGAHSVQAPTATESTQSSFGFMSTIDARNHTVFDSSSASTEPSSPTAFGFMRGSNTSSTTPTVASSSVSQAQSQRSVLQEPEPSMFSFISN
ncbi:hypothetical protein PHMEG_00012352 [Phytophthora megakarya]|uniref:VHS domain-containing protein n=1 Tax=Phytophthora megakarya TaxID=4795 RepID=A0A225W9X5_9STRA|nr:hypothetical protein PHMEG_00012352 [Phytophthora megakarya]